MQPLLLLLTLFLSLRAEAGEIIGGHETKPHSRPYMAFIQYWNGSDRKRCGGFLIREDFVLTAAHCQGSPINVTLGAHNINKPEKTWQVIPVRNAIPHPEYNRKDYSNDIMLLQGDSGGPLVCKNVAQGIVSHGKPQGPTPQVYTKISSFLSWIKETMRRRQLQEVD
ncbi:granzyme B-like isoform X2 [Ochotona curzoniae]|uniref:granzyme B-like isoform X2 n=1 Tax=Ochotona curzoniae TaxID=130825 RepID=UPI001B348F21|nr:granzyme B-like isoform X2 [Ochotona curzoniae]